VLRGPHTSCQLLLHFLAAASFSSRCSTTPRDSNTWILLPAEPERPADRLLNPEFGLQRTLTIQHAGYAFAPRRIALMAYGPLHPKTPTIEGEIWQVLPSSDGASTPWAIVASTCGLAVPRSATISSDVRPRPKSRSSSISPSCARIRCFAGSSFARTSLRTRPDPAIACPAGRTAMSCCK